VRSPRSAPRPRSVRRRAIVAGVAVLLPALAAAIPALPAGAADGSSSVKCSTGSSCEIMLEHMIHFGGRNYSPGAENMVVDITPPPCLWIPQGDAHTGSQVVIDFYNNTDPGAGALFDGQHAFREAKQLVTQNPMPAGTWYELPINPNDTQAQIQECLNEPLFFWDVPGAPLPGIEVPPQTLAQLALAKMNVPQAGTMILSPRSGNSYSNLPTFSRVTLSFRPEFGPGGLPYVTDNAQLGGQGATVWVEATPLQLSTNDSAARLETAGCGYLGSTEMVRNPGAVAHTGANGTADCGVTFRQPGQWNITATLTWRACWAVGVQDGPPPAACNPVPGAAFNPVNWARNVNIHEIQAANGGG
jgi:hypothetical protein